MIPRPWTVGRRVWSQSGRDAHGNPRQSWADPVPVPIHGVAPRVQEEPFEAGRNPVVEGLTVYAPAGTQVGAHDRVVWPFIVDDDGTVQLAGDEYEVVGDVADWTKGPWTNPAAGVVINLSRVEG